MTLVAQIEAAFDHQISPKNVVEAKPVLTPEQRDALAFEGRHWREIRLEDWESHPDAFFAFSPRTFCFFLPSLLISALRAPGGHLQAANAFVGILDRSPDPFRWDTFLSERMVGLKTAEYEAIKAWLLSRSDGGLDDEDSLLRAYETVDLLALETSNLRKLLKVNEDPGAGPGS